MGVGRRASAGTGTSRLDPYRVRAVHLTALWAYGVTQPILSFVTGNPELLALRGATRTEVVAFALLLALVPPILVTAYAWLASRASRWVGDMFFLVSLGVFSAPLALEIIGPVDPSTVVATLFVLALATTLVVAYARWRPVRLFLAFSVVLPILGFASFVRGAPAAAADIQLAAPVHVAAPAPVVFVVLDEFPLSSLLTSTGEIDAVRYPSFARLARDATWYPNATTVHESTTFAVPAILSGMLPREGGLPVAADHPRNLFSLLGGSYSLEAHETMTALCPRSFCPRAGTLVGRTTSLVTDISTLYLKSALPREARPVHVWDDFHASRIDEFQSFLRGLSRPQPTRTLHFMHLLLPHAPYDFLPSGHAYAPAGLPGLRAERWGDDAWLVLQNYQRHLLQVAYTDRLIGRLIGDLRSAGLYDPALLVVVADHGVSFRAGDRRRPITGTNFADIANVPLFVKVPHQRQGGSDARAARTVDVLPTVAEVLGIRVPWRVDGTSLLSAPPARREAIVAAAESTLRMSMARLAEQTRATVVRKEAQFGRGRDSLYRIGVYRDLLGAAVPRTPAHSRAVRIRIRDESALLGGRESEAVVPALISGYVEEGEIDAGTELAVAVNGRIRALTRCSSDGDTQRFRALVPESALRVGVNTVDVFAIEVDGARRRLVRLGGVPSRLDDDGALASP